MNHEQIRQQVAKRYKDKIRTLEEDNRKFKQMYLEEKYKREELESELQMKNEWIERLLEFTDMTPEQVQRACKSRESVKAFADIINMMSKVTPGLF